MAQSIMSSTAVYGNRQQPIVVWGPAACVILEILVQSPEDAVCWMLFPWTRNFTHIVPYTVNSTVLLHNVRQYQ